MSEVNRSMSEDVPLMSFEDGIAVSNAKVNSPPIGRGGILLMDTLTVLKRSWLPLLVLSLVVLIVDVAVFIKHVQSPQVRNVDISLSESNAVVRTNGFVDKSSLTSTFDVAGGSCDYFYRKTHDAEWVKGGQLLAVFPSDGNNVHEFDVEVSADETEYGTLRRLVWDLSSSGFIDSGVRVECAIDLSAQVYRIIPVTYTYRFSQSLDMNSLRTTAVKTLKSQQEAGTKKPSISLVPQEISLGQAKFQLVINLHKKPKLVINQETLESFVVRIPQLSYATSFVNSTDAGSDYLVVQTGSAVFDLAQYSKPIAIDITVDCTPVAQTKDEALALIGTGKCILSSPLNVASFAQQFKDNKYFNIQTQGNANNFIMSFLGESHFIRTVDDSLFPGQVAGNSNARALSTDPAISTGANCVTVDADGVYVSQMCSEVEADFFKLFMAVYGDNAYVGEIDFVTSWAPTSQEVAFDSYLNASMVTGGNVYSLLSSVGFSENLKDFSFAALLDQSNYYSSEVLYNQQVNATWTTSNGGSSGVIHSNATTMISGMETVTSFGTLRFDNNAFSGEVLGYDASYPLPGDLVTATAQGGYRFSPSSWYLSLTDSSLSYETSEVGHANSVVGFFDGQNDDDSNPVSLVVLNFRVVDADYNIVTSSNYTFVEWFSNDNFVSNGDFIAASVFELYDGDYPSFSWNVSSILEYDSNEYVAGVVYNPMDLSPQNIGSINSQPVTSVRSAVDIRPLTLPIKNMLASQGPISSRRLQSDSLLDNDFLIYGGGHYGGDAVDLDFSVSGVLVVNHEYVGFTYANISYDFVSPSTSGQLGLDVAVADGNTQTIYENHGMYSYEVSGSQGAVFASSAVNVHGTGVQWNASASLSYGDNAYEFMLVENDYGTTDENFLVSGSGGYGGDWNSWWVSVVQSDLISVGSLVGHGVINLNYASVGGNATTTYMASYSDANDEPAINSVQYLSWVTDADTQQGTVAIYSHWDYMTSFAYNATAALAYGDNAFAINIEESDVSGGVSGNLTAVGTGNYHGSSSSWDASLTQSSLTMSGSLIGSAEGAISGTTPDAWDMGDVHLNYLVKDSSDSTVLTSTSETSWNTNSLWDFDGSIDLQSLIDVVGSKTFNTTGSFGYGDNSFNFGISEISTSESTSAVNSFELRTNGAYLFASANNFMFSVTNSIMRYNDAIYFNIRGVLQSAFAYSGDYASFVFGLVDYTDDNEQTYNAGDDYPQSNSAFWTQNVVAWDYNGDVAEGYLTTNTSVNADNAFALTSIVYANIANETAYFSVAESLSGVDGLDAWISGDYNMDTGMLASIGAQVSYEDVVYFGSVTTYDLQLDTINLPTASPTFAPTFSPSPAPTIYSDAPTVAPTVAPSFAPTLAPSAAPSLVPTLAPSAVPTVAPSAVPSVAPTLAPSEVPTIAPTAVPTIYSDAPTFAPTFAPSATPTTASPSVAPTAAPTVVSQYPTIAPTFAPTIAPSAAPTAAPTLYPTIVFTNAPTVANAPTITFSASQTIAGIDITSYNSNFDANQQALMVTIASCMTGVSATDVHNLVVTGSRRRLAMRVEMVVDVLANSISASYTIIVTSFGVSYSSLSSELTSNINSGVFNTLLHENAAAYNASDLGSASSSSVSTTNLTPSSSNKNLSGGAIAGIVIGVVFGTAIIAAIAYYIVFMRESDSGEVSATFAKGVASKENPVRDDFVSHENVARDKLRGRSPQKGTADDDL